MQKEPDRRYLSVDTFLIDLRAAIQEASADSPFSVELAGDLARGDAAPNGIRVAALYAEVLVDGQAVDLDALDDDALDAVEDVVEQVVTRAQADGHVLALRTSTSVMACSSFAEAVGEGTMLERMIDFARTLAEELRGRTAGGGRIELAMYLDIGEAQRSGAGASQTLSGPFIEARAWLASPLVPGTWMSRSVVESVMNLSCDTAWFRVQDN
jgi:hypothetical protein